MTPPFLAFYAFNTALEIEPLSLQNGKIMDGRWNKFQEVVNIVKAVAIKLDLNLVLDSSGLPSSRKKQIIILLSDPPEHFSTATTFTNLIANKGFRSLGNGNPREAKTEQDKKFNYQPIVAIGYEDIMHLFAEDGQDEKAKNHYLRSHNLDPRYKFLDSSIWHRYIPVFPNSSGSFPKEHPTKIDKTVLRHFKKVLEETLKHIAECHEKELYETNAAKAMLEFQLRMLRDSYIIPFGEHNHAMFVTPFKFHSETQMQMKADRLLQQFFDANGLRSALKWRFLLVDDYANIGISKVGGYIETSKKELIEHLLNGFNIEIDYPREKGHGEEDSAKTDIIAKCLSRLSEQARYDILLLDYLLATTRGGQEREYGYEFLQPLQEDSESEDPQYKRGPFMRYWIFPISSFPFALYDKLRQLGIDNYHELWHMAGGGDPITTPHLFRYNLLNFLKQQVLEAYLDDESLARQLSTYSYIKDRVTWSEVMKAHVGHLLAQIEILKSYRPKDTGNNDKAIDFSGSLYNHINTTDYGEILEECLKLVQLAKALNDKARDFSSFVDGKTPPNLYSRGQTITYPISINVLREKFREYFYTTEELNEQLIEKYSLSIFNAGDKIILSLPQNIGTAKNIKTLELPGHWLKALPKELTDLNRLRSLDLRNNKLKKFPEVLFALKEQLVYLDLRGNPLPNDLDIEAKSRLEVQELFAKAESFQLKTIIESIKDINEIHNLKERINELYNLIYTGDPELEELKREISNLKFRHNQNESFYDNGKITAEAHGIENVKIFDASWEIISAIERRFKQLEP